MPGLTLQGEGGQEEKEGISGRGLQAASPAAIMVHARVDLVLWGLRHLL